MQLLCVLSLKHNSYLKEILVISYVPDKIKSFDSMLINNLSETRFVMGESNILISSNGKGLQIKIFWHHDYV